MPVAPRALAYLSRAITGIEIHPAARVGDALFIDHGMGVVIGETAEVGANVTVYQGVTLGGTGFATGKRHPTVQDNVTIGSGAKLLGPITIGHGAKIGANAVVIHDVPPHSTVVGNPGHPVRVEGRKPEGPDADWVHLPDPIADALKLMSGRIAALEREIAELRGEEPGPQADVVPLRPARGPEPGRRVACARALLLTLGRDRQAARGRVPVAARRGQGAAVDERPRPVRGARRLRRRRARPPGAQARRLRADAGPRADALRPAAAAPRAASRPTA